MKDLVVYSSSNIYKSKMLSKIKQSDVVNETKIIKKDFNRSQSTPTQSIAKSVPLNNQLENIPGLKSEIINESQQTSANFYSRYKTDFKEVKQLGIYI